MASPDHHPLTDILDESFFTRLRAQLSRLTRQYRTSGVEAEDLFQTVVIKLWKSDIPRRNLSDHEFAEYLLARGSRAGRNWLIDTARRRRQESNADTVLSLTADERQSLESPQSRFLEICQTVRRVTENMPIPPPREFVAAWYGLFQRGEVVKEEQVGSWQQEFGKGRATIYRWIHRVLLEVRNRVAR